MESIETSDKKANAKGAWPHLTRGYVQWTYGASRKVRVRRGSLPIWQDMISMREACSQLNPVFSYGGTPLNNRNASQDDIRLSLAKYVPAVSSPVGVSAALNRNNVNLNDVSDVGRPNEWGRDHNVYEESWLHSDMKDMAYFYVYKLYEQLVTRGDMQ